MTTHKILVTVLFGCYVFAAGAYLFTQDVSKTFQDDFARYDMELDAIRADIHVKDSAHKEEIAKLKTDINDIRVRIRTAASDGVLSPSELREINDKLQEQGQQSEDAVYSPSRRYYNFEADPPVVLDVPVPAQLYDPETQGESLPEGGEPAEEGVESPDQ